MDEKCLICGKPKSEIPLIYSFKYDDFFCEKCLDGLSVYEKALKKLENDLNKYIFHEEEGYAEIKLENKAGEYSCSAIVDIEDVSRCRKYRWYAAKVRNTTYCKAYIHGKVESLHRFVLEYGGNDVVDHINRNGLDNRKKNLRVVSVSENGVNSERYSQTGLKNIGFYNGRYRVQIKRNGETVFLKSYEKLEDAIFARDSFLNKYNKQNKRKC